MYSLDRCICVLVTQHSAIGTVYKLKSFCSVSSDRVVSLISRSFFLERLENKKRPNATSIQEQKIQNKTRLLIIQQKIEFIRLK